MLLRIINSASYCARSQRDAFVALRFLQCVAASPFQGEGFVTGDGAQHNNGEVLRYGTRAEREREFEKLYNESYELVYNYVRYRMTGDAATEDVVAEAYLHAARAFDSFDATRAKFSTWVTKIAINCMKGYWRKSRPTAALDGISDKYIAQPHAADEVADRALVDQLLGALDEVERELVLMKYREGYRNVDIAAELDMNASTVSTKLAHALAKMRAEAERNA